MAYQVYFGDLTEENQAFVLTLLRLKEEAGTIEPNEAELLYTLRGSRTPSSYPPPEEPFRQGRSSNNRRSNRRGSGNGRSHGLDS